jgi:hypothetical protein
MPTDPDEVRLWAKTGSNRTTVKPTRMTRSGHHAPLDASFPLDDDYTLVAELELRPHGRRRLAAESWPAIR